MRLDCSRAKISSVEIYEAGRIKDDASSASTNSQKISKISISQTSNTISEARIVNKIREQSRLALTPRLDSRISWHSSSTERKSKTHRDISSVFTQLEESKGQ